MNSTLGLHRLAVIAGGSALAAMAVLAATSNADAGRVPLTPGGGAGPTTSTAVSVAPTPVDCNDPNNAINCQSPPIDSPLVSGTAAPGSPYRD